MSTTLPDCISKMTNILLFSVSIVSNKSMFQSMNMVSHHLSEVLTTLNLPYDSCLLLLILCPTGHSRTCLATSRLLQAHLIRNSTVTSPMFASDQHVQRDACHGTQNETCPELHNINSICHFNSCILLHFLAFSLKRNPQHVLSSVLHEASH